ncbi:hypothetical protein [Candidatus Protochlamydia sp. R18]|uniref:hypothetical protein n=1 Tax=Candidatus Protochlamydia sp. R18 TaxID=1353977 RepID=UPI0005AAA3D9|nr:hypothetical protein [Candidatus Protochlamydia sp. R18]
MYKQYKNFLFYTFILAGYLPSFVCGRNISLVDSEGRLANFSIAQEDKFTDVIDWLECYYKNSLENIQPEGFLSNDLALTIVVSNNDVLIRKSTTNRDYYAEVSKDERKDIDFIVTSLAYESLLSLASLRSDLQDAGKRIDKVHPLNFLKVIFTDEKLKTGVHAIRNRTIWNEFIAGNVTSLNEEFKKNNLKDEYIRDFSRKIGVDFNKITPYIKQKKWKEFVNYLIDNIPRVNDPNRYNM